MTSTLDPACFREIVLPEPMKSTYVVEDGLDYLSELSRLNVFIGPNNSGKSRLIRSLFAEPDLLFSDGEQLDVSVREAKYLLRELLQTVGDSESGISRNESIANAARYLAEKLRPLFRSTRGGARQVDESGLQNLRVLVGGTGLIDRIDREHFRSTMERARDFLNGLKGGRADNHAKSIELARVYIPSLRGLRPLFGRDFGESPNEKSLRPPYQRRTEKDYFKESSVRYTIAEGLAQERTSTVFTGCELYNLIRDRLLGNRAQRQVVREFEDFLSKVFFDGQEITLVPHVGHDVLVVKIGQQPELPIYQLGDGIQQIIILTFPLFEFREKRLCLFIEEPELYLHPGLQMLLIDSFLKPRNPNHQVFVATHSQHFIDMSIDRSLCSVYRVTKEIADAGPDQDSTATHHVHHVPQREMEVLRLLGVRNSSVFLANCTVWVEGVTDRIYLRHFIKLYMKSVAESADAGEAGGDSSGRVSLVEGLHYSFVEYGGGNITHYSFLDEENGIDVLTLCGELLLIADTDGKATVSNMPKKVERFQKLEKALENRFLRLPCREIENLTSPQVLAKVIREYEEGKCELREVEHEEYLSKPLGKFIEEEILKGVKSSRRSKSGHPYQDESGTIKAKADFCEKVIRHTERWEDLSSYARDLTRSVVKFIESHNAKSQGRM